ncbi:site-2 protease family protein [Granulicella sibirica]|uniref:Membrane metalloprotease n=1 Tax=Granulicella sibirica TaxID=2479048 RepID=A0A4Q0T6I9_9BACT|nr:site-2 protease family protein [Granulicella sibirica]RXH57718.1 Membrane metalloprotease [Granulicella sibirica]
MTPQELQTDSPATFKASSETSILIEAAVPISNCPECSLWLPPGTLQCPECHMIIYSAHLHRIATAAAQQEAASEWGPARATWQQALAWLPPESSQAKSVCDHIAQIDARFRSEDERKARWTKRLGPLAPIAFFLLKAKTFLFAIFKLKFLFSFLAFFGVYWALFGWRFGLGFTSAILIHEIGHYIAARRYGLKVDLPLFIPGLGAYVRWYHEGVSVEILSGIALAGPLFGLFTAVGFVTLAHVYSSQLFLALAYSAAFLNLFNLVPVLGLDGAQATFALNRLQRYLLIVTSVLLYALLREWVFLAIAAGMTWRAVRGPSPEQPSSRAMIVFTLLLFALGAIMWAAPDLTRGNYGMFNS